MLITTFFCAFVFGLVFLKMFGLQRRNTLEEWMQKLLSDIDLSRSAPVAAFLELEAAARSCMCIDP